VLFETVAFPTIRCVSISVTMTVFWHEHQWNSALNHITGHAALSLVNDWQSGSRHRSNDQIPNDDTISYVFCEPQQSWTDTRPIYAIVWNDLSRVDLSGGPTSPLRPWIARSPELHLLGARNAKRCWTRFVFIVNFTWKKFMQVIGTFTKSQSSGILTNHELKYEAYHQSNIGN
jgi:hypothetical protein